MDQPKKKITKKKVLYYSLLCLFAAVFLCSSIYLIHNFIVRAQDKNLNNQLQNMVASGKPTETESQPTEEAPTGEESQPTEAPTEPQILPEYQALYDMNNDLVGWLSIPDTNINYPVMQTPHEPNFYLHRNFNKEYSYGGTLYAREDCDINAPSDNITIYGHRMEIPSRDMFFELDKFKNESWFRDHQTFTFDTLYEHHTYQIVAVFITSANEGQGYPYHRFVNAANEQEFNEFIATIKDLGDDYYYETGVTAQYGDKLICLSTCEYILDNGRFVVVAKRIS